MQAYEKMDTYDARCDMRYARSLENRPSAYDYLGKRGQYPNPAIVAMAIAAFKEWQGTIQSFGEHGNGRLRKRTL
jgi:hypothetical protein